MLPTNRGECAGGPKGLLDLARNTLTWSDLLTLDGWWVEESGVWAHRTPAVVAGDSCQSTLVTKFRFTGQIETPGPHRKPWCWQVHSDVMVPLDCDTNDPEQRFVLRPVG